MNKLQIRIDESRIGGEIFAYHLMTKRGTQHFSNGGEIQNADEMRQIAAALIIKADEIEKGENNA